MYMKIVAAVAVSAILLSGCSSRPRNFNAQLTVPPQDLAAFQESEAHCRELALTYESSGADRAVSAGTGIAAGAGAVAVGSAAGGTYATMGGAMAAMGALAVAAPVVGIGAAWLIARNKRANKEERINEFASSCLLEQGYEVSGWTRVGRSASEPTELANAEQQ